MMKTIHWIDGVRARYKRAMEVVMDAVLMVMGILAGTLTTVAGMGGGLMAVLALSVVMEPSVVLAITAPALLVGNLHRLVTWRTRVDVVVVRPLLAGALPGALLGGFAVAWVPSWVLRVAMAGVLVLAILRASGRISMRWPPRVLIPVGGGVGVLSAMGSGAGVLVGPVLMGAGLTGEPYVATSAAVGVTIHVGRLIAYGAGGLLHAGLAWPTLLLTLSILVGNGVGKLLRRFMDAAVTTRVEVTAMVVSVALAAVGVSR